MSECPDLGVAESSKQRDDVISHVLVVEDAVLTLPHKDTHKVTEAAPELLVVLPRYD